MRRTAAIPVTRYPSTVTLPELHRPAGSRAMHSSTRGWFDQEPQLAKPFRLPRFPIYYLGFLKSIACFQLQP